MATSPHPVAVASLCLSVVGACTGFVQLAISLALAHTLPLALTLVQVSAMLDAYLDPAAFGALPRLPSTFHAYCREANMQSVVAGNHQYPARPLSP